MTNLYNQITNNSCEVFNEFIERFIIPSDDDDEQFKRELLTAFKDKLNLYMKNNVKKHLTEWVKNKVGATEDEIDNLSLSKYMDSLDIFDLMAEVEDHYHIEVSDKELLKWYDATINDISNYVVKTLCG